jgi:outer membrane scaffolding protein for murein synthesis (MipA/OmpV family)
MPVPSVRDLPTHARLAFGLLVLLVCGTAQADQPLWEIGAGVGAASFPEYRGSNERTGYVLPIPYLVYRGERLRVGRDGARGVLAESGRYELDISVDGAVPVESSDDGPRAGMAELDPVIEAGPTLDRKLGATGLGRWTLRLPLRAAIATDLDSTSHEGWTFHPQLRMAAPDLVGGWDFGFSAGPRLGSRDYHAYYYDVGVADVARGRGRYRASAGYSGLALRGSASRRFGKWWVGGFFRYDNLSGTAFEDSPLVETKHALAVGFGVSWVFRQSAARVTGRQ